MAIKTISLLDEFDSNTTNHGQPGISASNLAFLEDGYLTKHDMTFAKALGGELTSYNEGATLLNDG